MESTNSQRAADPRIEQVGALSWRERFQVIVVFSIAFALAAAVLSVPLSVLNHEGWWWTFAVVRWVGIIGMVAYLLARKTALPGLPMPAALATPVTIALLMTESVCIDIVSARVV